MILQILTIGLIVFITDGFGFTCNQGGIFPNSDDSTCQTYIFCLKLSDGVWIQKEYNCSQGTIFDPQVGGCSRNSTCELTPSGRNTVSATPTANVDSCTSQGKFPNQNDSTCSLYYFCYYLPNGTYTKMQFSCPINTKFDPNLQTCNTAYQCLSNASTSVSTIPTPALDTFNCTQQGRFSVKEDVTCGSYYYCLYLPSGGYTKQIFNCSLGTKFDSKLQTCSATYNCTIQPISVTSTVVPPTIFTPINSSPPLLNTFLANDPECLHSGKIPVVEDNTCQTYYYCFILPTGSFGKQLYICPTGEKFNPDVAECSKNYQCSISASTEEFNSISPECSSEGRFPLANDDSCQIYYYCFYLPNGEIGYQVYSCSDGETFSPELSVCTKYYECSTSSNSEITDISTSSSSMCASIGKFPVESDDSCRNYYYCFHLPTGEMSYEFYSCVGGEKFNPEIEACTKDYQCSISSTSETAEISTSSTSIECTSIGKFPADNDDSCRSYYYCFYLPNGEITYQYYNCTAGKKFNPETGACTKDYQCSISSTMETTEMSTGSSSIECKSIGKFAVDFDDSCRNYYYCFHLPNGEIGHQLYSCTAGEQFSPVLGKCTEEYLCPKFPNTETTTDTNNNKECVSEGKNPVIDDDNCRTYYYCFRLPNGELGHQIYSCTAGEKFDPVLEICTEDFQCSSASETVQSTITSTTTTDTNSNKECFSEGKYPVMDDDNCRTYYYCSRLPNGELGHQIYSCTAGEKFDPVLEICTEDYQCALASETVHSTITSTTDHFCSSIGKFSVENDDTCQMYYYCFQQPNGQISYQPYRCTIGENFNPALGRCTKDYQCPKFSNTPS